VNPLFLDVHERRESIIEQKPSPRKMLELTQFKELVDHVLYNRFYCNEKEIRGHTEYVRSLVEKWKRE